MDDKTIRQELAAIWDKIGSEGRQQSAFTDTVHTQSTEGISENSGSILDIADLSDENSNSITELADMINNLEERVKALEEK